MSASVQKDDRRFGFLTKDSIVQRCYDPEPGKVPLIVPEPNKKLEEECFHSWSYDLRLGQEVFLSSGSNVKGLRPSEALFIHPGDFALLTTEESLNIPLDLVAFITLRFQIALKGLVNVSGFHVDPDFHGRLVFSVYNAGPNTVVLRRSDPVFMIVFAFLDRDAKPGDRDGAAFKDINKLKAEWIAAAKGPSVNMVKLNREVERLKTLVNLLIGVLVATAGTIAAALALGVR